MTQLNDTNLIEIDDDESEAAGEASLPSNIDEDDFDHRQKSLLLR